MTRKYYFFETRKRDTGEEFTTLLDDAPDWLKAAVRDAHNGALPNDWVFEECKAAFDAGTDPDELDDYVDGRVEVYTRPLFQWAADMCLTNMFAEAQEEASEFGRSSDDMEKRLQAIQYCAIRYIATVMVQAEIAAIERSHRYGGAVFISREC